MFVERLLGTSSLARLPRAPHAFVGALWVGSGEERGLDKGPSPPHPVLRALIAWREVETVLMSFRRGIAPNESWGWGVSVPPISLWSWLPTLSLYCVITLLVDSPVHWTFVCLAWGPTW